MGGSFQCVFISLRLKELITDGLEKKHKDWRNHCEVQSLSAPNWINEILFLDVWRSSVSFSVLFKLLREEKRLKRVSLITSSWWSTRWVTAYCLFIQIRPEGDSNQQQWLWLSESSSGWRPGVITSFGLDSQELGCCFVFFTGEPVMGWAERPWVLFIICGVLWQRGEAALISSVSCLPPQHTWQPISLYHGGLVRGKKKDSDSM